jgi:hypothetical protein
MELPGYITFSRFATQKGGVLRMPRQRPKVK